MIPYDHTNPSATSTPGNSGDTLLNLTKTQANSGDTLLNLTKRGGHHSGIVRASAVDGVPREKERLLPTACGVKASVRISAQNGQRHGANWPP